MGYIDAARQGVPRGVGAVAARACFILNPFAGAGGRRAWKGTDWPLPLRIAGEAGPRELPAWRRAERFAVEMARQERVRGLEILWLAPPNPMGRGPLEGQGLRVERVPCIVEDKWPTSPDDTVRCVEECLRRDPRLVVFAGGDGTARLVASAVRGRVPILGVPAGVKVYSAVFSPGPEAAARLTADFLGGLARVEEREVLDIDEEAFRRGELKARLWGYHPAPVRPGLVVGGKQAYHSSGELWEIGEIAEYFRDEIAEPCALLLLGPGRTVYEIKRALGVEGSLLGVDAVHDGRLVGRDLDEEGLLRAIRETPHRKVLIVVSPIGGQGFILGRGNQQISPRVLRLAGPGSLVVVATPTKLRGLRELLVDTGDPDLDRQLSGYIRVLTGYNRFRVVPVRPGSGEE